MQYYGSLNVTNSACLYGKVNTAIVQAWHIAIVPVVLNELRCCLNPLLTKSPGPSPHRRNKPGPVFLNKKLK